MLAQDFDRMADELQRAWLRQTELTRNVSHELRSPLARLRVALELARRQAGELPEFEKIDAETGRIDEMIGQLLEYSRLDADTHEEHTSINLDELVLPIVEDVRYEYAGSNKRITLEADAGVEVRGYANALRSGIENVLRNAMQHSRDGGSVDVRIHKDGPQAVITVADQGGGVSDDELEKIFEPFYRAAQPQAESREGSGLGLAIAARAIEMNSGSVTASNEAGGLSVEIRLALVD